MVMTEMRLKFLASLPRPTAFAQQLMPMIATPEHSTYPSGHATEAFALATVLSALEVAGAGNTAPVAAVLTRVLGSAASDPAMLAYRLAARIADNRTVAGLHFPVDSAHGALLGLATGLGFVASCAATSVAIPSWQAAGSGWTTAFSLDLWLAALPGWQGADVAVPAAAIDSPLALLWANAVAEWV